MTTDNIGLYVHIPFCRKKCSYCDFLSFAGCEASLVDEYVDALCREIHGYKSENLTLSTLFFGGGTPSLLSLFQFEKILGAIRESFALLPNAEITTEANPGTLDRDKLKGLYSLGINRLSIGLQSIHENELKILGRIHSYEDFLSSYRAAREVGFRNINVDLMYGIPEQTEESFAKTLDALISLSPEHISVYGLMLEEGTPLYESRESLALPTEDAECDMYYSACRRLAEAGYRHYEISNYAKEGFESRHNLIYWHTDSYIGVGAAAHSYFRGKRFCNTEQLSAYISNPIGKDKCEQIDAGGAEYEYAMLALRLSEGISLSEYERRFSRSFLSGREEKLAELSALGYLLLTHDRVFLTDKGMYVSNYILTELL